MMSSNKLRPVLFWTRRETGWVAGCRRRGHGHIIAAADCQDHGVARLIHLDGNLAGYALAVADGHGGRRHDRSARGARIATRLATLLLRRLSRGADDASLVRRFRDDFPKRLARQWRRQVLDDALSSGDPPAGAVERYGTTIVVGLFTERLCLAGQIGDGDALLLRRDGMRRLVDPDQSTIGLATHSLCEPAAHRHWRMSAAHPPRAGDILLLATDGFADSFATADDVTRFSDDLWQRISCFGASRVAGELPVWLDRLSHDGSGDDITVMMASLAPDGTPP